MSLADGQQVLIGQSVFDVLNQHDKYRNKFRRYLVTVKHDVQIQVFQYVGKLPYLDTATPKAILGIRYPRSASNHERIGLTHVYPSRLAAKPDILADISNSNESCKMFAAVYHSELIKEGDRDDFVKALLAATFNARAKKRKYRILFCSLGPNLGAPADKTNKVLLTCWAKHEDKTVVHLKGQFRMASVAFKALVSEVSKQSKGNISSSRRYFKDYLMPHASLVVDNRIVYISLYDWTHTRGTTSLTLRLENGIWAKQYVEEAGRLETVFSIPVT